MSKPRVFHSEYSKSINVNSSPSHVILSHGYHNILPLNKSLCANTIGDGVSFSNVCRNHLISFSNRVKFNFCNASRSPTESNVTFYTSKQNTRISCQLVTKNV